MIGDDIFSKALQSVRVSEISRLVALVSQDKSIISLAAGMPANEVLPIGEIGQAVSEILEENGPRALQYGPIQGSMIDAVLEVLKAQGIKAEGENIMITTGSLQATFLITMALVDPDDVIITESPTYSINLETFRAFQGRIIGVPMNEAGLRTDILEGQLSGLKKKNIRPKFIYTIPDFQNPTGISASLTTRQEIIAVAREFDVPVLEDSPYYFLRYEWAHIPTLRELGGDRIIHMGSFSKVFSSGLRVGYIVAHKDIVRKLKLIKQGIDFCTPVLSQLIIKKLIDKGLLEKQVRRVVDIHGKKLKVMAEALEKYMPPEVQWIKPQGGIFLWLTLPKGINGSELINSAIENKVIFVPGDAFFPEANQGGIHLRLNFTYPSEEEIVGGIRALSRVIKKFI